MDRQTLPRVQNLPGTPGWDRTAYFLILNSAILTVATGLLKLDHPPIVYLFVAPIFAFGALSSIAGVFSIEKSHEYYRRTIVKKTAIEEQLGLSTSLPGRHSSLSLAIGTTTGHNDRVNILSDPEKWVSRRRCHGAISSFFGYILLGNGNCRFGRMHRSFNPPVPEI